MGRAATTTPVRRRLRPLPTGSGDSDFLTIGDLNAYAMEDPITTLEAKGYTDLVEQSLGTDAYSYVFFGQAGYLCTSHTDPGRPPSSANCGTAHPWSLRPLFLVAEQPCAQARPWERQS